MKNLVGKVLSINELAKLVTLETIHEAFHRQIDVEVTLVAKYIKPGQHVKIVRGSHIGQTGRVVDVRNINDGDLIAVVLIDSINTETSCSVAHLEVCLYCDSMYCNIYFRFLLKLLLDLIH